MLKICFLGILHIAISISLYVRILKCSEVDDACGLIFNQSLRNSNNVYEDKDNCRGYIQCLGGNNRVTGLQMTCEDREKWCSRQSKCVLDLNQQCTDKCFNKVDGTTYKSHYFCSIYFICFNNVSIRMCCPLGTKYNETLQTCVKHWKCPNYCRASRTRLCEKKPVNNDPQSFVSHGSTFQCPWNGTFLPQQCECKNYMNSYGNKLSRSLLFLPFNVDFKDYSGNNVAVKFPSSLELNLSKYVRGFGSVMMSHNSFFEVTALSQKELSIFSICFFLKCDFGQWCQSSLVIGGKVWNITVNTKLQIIFEDKHFAAFVETDDFVHICLVSETPTHITLFTNGIYRCNFQVTSPTTSSQFQIKAMAGDIFLDEILLCDFALKPAEILAHFTGNNLLEKLHLIPYNFDKTVQRNSFWAGELNLGIYKGSEVSATSFSEEFSWMVSITKPNSNTLIQ